MNDLYKQMIGSIVRGVLMLISGYLVTKHVLNAPADATLIDMLTSNIVAALPAIAAQVWSAGQKWYQLKLTNTALQATPGTSMDTIKDRVVSGRGASLNSTVGVLLLTAAVLSLTASGCATLKTAGSHPPTAAQVVGWLDDAKWGLSEACSKEWVPAKACDVGLASLDAAIAAVNKDPIHAAEAGYEVLVAIDNSLATTDRLKPFIHGAVVVLQPFIPTT